WTQHVTAVEALALCRAESPRHFDHLPVPCRKIIEDGVAEYVLTGAAGTDVRPAAAGDHGKLQFIVHQLAVFWPFHHRPGTADAEPVGDVEDGNLLVDVRQWVRGRRHEPFGLRLIAAFAREMDLHALRPLHNVLGEGHGVTKLARQ